MQRDALIAMALLTAAAAPLVVFVLGDTGSGAASVVLGVYAALAPAALLGLGLAWRRERRARHRTNRETWALLHANLKLRESAQALLQEARHDPLTGLENRRAWRETLEREARRAARYGGEPAVIMLDLDGFKAVNDSLGHEAGDDVLVRVSDVFRRCLRESDVLARLGGDEFGVLLPVTKPGEATLVAEKLRRNLETAGVMPAGVPRPVTVSVGVASAACAAPDDGARLLRAADAALYDAKAAGRKRVVVAAGDAEPLRRAA